MRMQECCDIRAIISLHYNQVKAYLINRTGNTDLAEDLVQETMVKLIDAYNRNTILQNPRAWLFQIAKNKLADTYREKRIWKLQDFDGFSQLNLDEYNEDTPSDFIHAMIKLLPEKYGYPVYLSDIEAKKLNEIAEKLNLSLSATKMRVQRGRKKLYEMFKECCDIEYSKNGKFCSCTIKESCLPLLHSQNLID